MFGWRNKITKNIIKVKMLEGTLNQCMNFRKLSAKRHVSWLRVLENVKQESEIKIEITHAVLQLAPTKFKTITSRTHDMSRVSVGMFVLFSLLYRASEMLCKREVLVRESIFPRGE